MGKGDREREDGSYVEGCAAIKTVEDDIDWTGITWEGLIWLSHFVNELKGL